MHCIPIRSIGMVPIPLEWIPIDSWSVELPAAPEQRRCGRTFGRNGFRHSGGLKMGPKQPLERIHSLRDNRIIAHLLLSEIRPEIPPPETRP